MRKTTFWTVITAGTLMFIGTSVWVQSGKRALEAQASTRMEAARIDTFSMMRNAKNLPTQESEDFSLVFPSQVMLERSSVGP